MRAFVIALLAVACLALDTEFQIEANFSKKNRDLFKSRISLIGAVSVPVPYITLNGLIWTSIAAEGSILNKTASADVIAALHTTGGQILAIKYPPMTFGTYIAGKTQFNPSVFLNAFVSGSVDAEASVGLVGYMIPGLMEFDPDGNFIKGTYFGRDWSSLTQVSGTQPGIDVRKSSITDGPCTITQYIVASNVAGYLKFAHTPVSPNSLEEIYEIKNYQYANSKNHLELVFATAVVTANAKGKVDLEGAFNEISKDFSTYAAIKAEAEIDGKSKSIKVKAAAEGDLDSQFLVLGDLKSKIQALFHARGEVSIDYKRIPFPANAKNIIFDPAIGAGKVVYNSASSVVLSVLAVLLAVFLLF